MANEVKKITRKNWTSRFNLVGRPKLGDYTFKMDEHSNKSSWIYNSMNLCLDCGEKFGNCYSSMMGGYSPERATTLYAHGKDENGRDDFGIRMEIDWDDRFDEDLLDKVGDMNFIKVGLERDVRGQTVTKRFLSPYDAIEYIHDNLTEDMIVNVSGNLRYTTYNDHVTINKDITSIYLSRVEDPKDFHASFTQSVIIDKESCNTKDIDKDTGIMPIDVIVLDYIKEFNGHEIRGQWPYHMNMEYQFDLSDKDKVKKIYEKLFKVKKGYTQITFDGEFVSNGGTVTPTIDDIPEDIRSLIGIVYTEEEALEQCATNANRENHMFLKRPSIFMVTDQNNPDNKNAVLQMFPEHYTEDELDMSWVYTDNTDDDEDDDPPFGNDENDEDGNTGDDDDWLSMLD